MTYEHQERYRRRTLLKAKYFDQANAQRMESIRTEFAIRSIRHPETDACKPFFLSHPRATWFPDAHLCIGDPEDMFTGEPQERTLSWTSSIDKNDEDARFHAALMYVALSSATSLDVDVVVTWGDSAWLPGDGSDEVATVRKEIEELRACGMWVTE